MCLGSPALLQNDICRRSTRVQRGPDLESSDKVIYVALVKNAVGQTQFVWSFLRLKQGESFVFHHNNGTIWQLEGQQYGQMPCAAAEVHNAVARLSQGNHRIGQVL